jgi:hypothetical protein
VAAFGFDIRALNSFARTAADARNQLFTAPRRGDVEKALRHIQRGRQCVQRQYDVIDRLNIRGLSTDEAERLLDWLKEMQLTFVNDYKQLLRKGQEALEAAGCVDPTTESDSDLQTASRHARWARECVRQQYEVIENLRLRSLPTEEAERGLSWFLETQRGFEDDYKRLLSEGQERLRAAGYIDPMPTWG